MRLQSIRQTLLRLWRRKIWEKLIELLRQGLSPTKLSQSVALGIAFGTFPVIGATAILCTIGSAALRLNLGATQLVNLLVAPVQLALLLPFIRLGEALFRAPALSLSLEQIVSLVTTDPMTAIHLLWWSTMHAIVAWLIIGPPAGFLSYLAVKPVFLRAAPSLRRGGRIPSESIPE